MTAGGTVIFHIFKKAPGVIALCLLAPFSLQAQSAYTGPGGTAGDPVSGNWNSAASWSPAGIPVSSGSTVLTFGGDAASPGYTSTNNIPGALKVGGIILESDSSGESVIQGNKLILTGTLPVLYNTTASDFEIKNDIDFSPSGPAGLSGIAVNGSLVLSGKVGLNSDLGVLATPGGLLEIEGPVNLGNATRTVEMVLDGSEMCFGGAISGGPAGGLTLKAAPGAFVTVQMCGEDSNTYAGKTTIGARTALLMQKEKGAIAVAGDLTVQSGGVAVLFDSSDQIATTSKVTVNGQLELFSLSHVVTQTLGNLQGSGEVMASAGPAELTVLAGNFSGTVGNTCGCPDDLKLIKDGSGTLTLTGDTEYDGGTLIRGGTLVAGSGVTLGDGDVVVDGGTLVNNGQLAGDVTVLKGQLQGSGGIDGSLVSNGFISPGNSPGTLTIGGNLTLKPKSTLGIEVASSGSFDKLSVGGAAALDGTVVVSLLGGFVPEGGEKFKILTAGGPVTGRFLKLSDSLAAFDVKALYGSQDVTLEFVEVPYTASAVTPNQFSVAQVLNRLRSGASGDLGTVISSLNTLNVEQFRNALTQISPQQLGALRNVSFSQSTAQTLNIERRFAELRGGRTGLSLQNLQVMNLGEKLDFGTMPLLASNDAASTGYGVKSLKNVMANDDPDNPWGFFASGSGQFGDFEQSLGTTGYNFNTAAMTMGADYKLKQNLAVGVLGGYSGTDADLSTNGSKAVIDGARFGVYGTWWEGGWYANAMLGGGYNWYQTDRRIVFGGIDRTATGSPDGQEFHGVWSGGYEFKEGGWTFGPTMGLNYDWLGINSFTETGAGALDLNYQDQESDSFRSRLGGKVAYAIECGDVTWIPEASVAWQHEYLDPGSAFSAQFAGGAGGFFNTEVQSPGRDSALLGFTLQTAWSETISTYVSYDTQVGSSDFMWQSVNGGMRVRF
jgi:autotransporter-associated beta strand protein